MQHETNYANIYYNANKDILNKFILIKIRDIHKLRYKET